MAKSAEFSGAMVMLFAWAGLCAWAPVILRRAASLILDAIELISAKDPQNALIGPFLLAALGELGLMIAPPLALGFAAALFFNYLQIGALLSLKPLTPEASRMDPIAGLKRIFEPKKAVDLAKNTLKLSASGLLAYLVLRGRLDMLIELPRLDLGRALRALADMIFDLGIYLGGALLGFGIFDLFWQRYQHEKSLMMGKDEVKREYKQSQGDPQLKGQRKQLHRELTQGGGLEQVKEADVVVVNPTHVAVALHYDRAAEAAPKVLSAGRGQLARAIKRLARHHGVPIIRNVPLARALVDTDLDHEIPAEFYEPVAQLLIYVYQLREEAPK